MHINTTYAMLIRVNEGLF